MAIEAKIKKNNSSMVIPAAYIIIGQLSMVRFLRPVASVVEDPETGQSSTVYTSEPATQYQAQAHIYWDRESRDQSFGSPAANVGFTFTHINRNDPIREAYEHITLRGLEFWTMTDMRDIYEADQP